jgi:hypothetical protein
MQEMAKNAMGQIAGRVVAFTTAAVWKGGTTATQQPYLACLQH